jgi:hypothetical protein
MSESDSRGKSSDAQQTVMVSRKFPIENPQRCFGVASSGIDHNAPWLILVTDDLIPFIA